MPRTIQRVGDASLKIELEFPDLRARDDFETAFRGWVTEYQHSATLHRLVSAGAGEAEDAGDEDDTAGHLLRIKTADTIYYVDLFPNTVWLPW